MCEKKLLLSSNRLNLENRDVASVKLLALLILTPFKFPGNLVVSLCVTGALLNNDDDDDRVDSLVPIPLLPLLLIPLFRFVTEFVSLSKLFIDISVLLLLVLVLLVLLLVFVTAAITCPF